MGRRRRPRKAWGRPNFLDPLILMWLDMYGERIEPRKFPRNFRNEASENELPEELTFTRQAVYHAFNRLAQRGFVRRVEGKILAYELVDPDFTRGYVLALWWRVDPPKPSSPRESARNHEKLKRTLGKAVEYYEKLPPSMRLELRNSIAEDSIMGFPFEGALSTNELLTMKEADVLHGRAKRLSDQKEFVSREKVWKIVPYTSRPRDWKRGSRKTPSLGGIGEVTCNATHSVSPAEHPPCPKCGVKTLFDHNLGAYFCPRCGLELRNE